MKLFFNILLIALPLSLLAQENRWSQPADSTTAGKYYLPSGIRLGVDIMGPALNFFDKRVLSYEFTAETDLGPYNLIAEGGLQSFAERNDNVDYSMQGRFFRIGPEVNFLSRDRHLNSFFFGLRYSWARFAEQVSGPVDGENWGIVPVNFDIAQNRSSWLEMTTGVKVRIWRGFFMGYIFRFRFARWGSEPAVPFEPYFVPGYGLAARNNTWGFRYYLMYRLQWRKKVLQEKKAKKQ